MAARLAGSDLVHLPGAQDEDSPKQSSSEMSVQCRFRLFRSCNPLARPAAAADLACRCRAATSDLVHPVRPSISGGPADEQYHFWFEG